MVGTATRLNVLAEVGLVSPYRVHIILNRKYTEILILNRKYTEKLRLEHDFVWGRGGSYTLPTTTALRLILAFCMIQRLTARARARAPTGNPRRICFIEFPPAFL